MKEIKWKNWWYIKLYTKTTKMGFAQKNFRIEASLWYLLKGKKDSLEPNKISKLHTSYHFNNHTIIKPVVSLLCNSELWLICTYIYTYHRQDVCIWNIILMAFITVIFGTRKRTYGKTDEVKCKPYCVGSVCVKLL